MKINSVFQLKSFLGGAIIGVTLVALYLAGADAPDPDWHALWWLRPLIVVGLAGAAAGFCFNVLTVWQTRNGWSRWPIYLLSALIALVAIWLGFVLGFNGTYWN